MNQAQANSPQSEDGIIWICSYPKSGNTWMRLLLGNYFFARDHAPLHINEIKNIVRTDASPSLYKSICAEKEWDLEEAMNDIEKRELFMAQYIRNNKGSTFLKSHSCFHSRKKTAYFGRSFTKGFIYIVRDPRDVLCSYVRHTGTDFDKIFEAMSWDKYFLMSEDNKCEYASSWDNHVKSFMGISFPTMIIRYEDLLANTERVLGQIVMSLKGKVEPEKLSCAVKNSSFSVLQKQEEKEGFVELPQQSQKFFASGESGGWKNILSPAQAVAIEERFGETMKKFGYL